MLYVVIESQPSLEHFMQCIKTLTFSNTKGSLSFSAGAVLATRVVLMLLLLLFHRVGGTQ